MLFLTIVIQTIFQTLFGIDRIPDGVVLCVLYADVVVFDAILA